MVTHTFSFSGIANVKRIMDTNLSFEGPRTSPSRHCESEVQEGTDSHVCCIPPSAKLSTREEREF